MPAIETIDRRLARNSNRLNDLMELLGEGTDEERSIFKAKIRAIQVENKELTAERARLEAHRVNWKRLQPQEAEDMLKDLVRLFEDAATGELGEEAVYRLLNVIKALSNGSIFIEAFSRPRRAPRIVRAHMQFSFNRLVETHCGVCNESITPHKVEFWLRPPPRLDRLAERVHELIDVQGLSMNETVDALGREGESVRHGYVWQCYARYYEMQKLPLPKKSYNNGKPRRSA